MTGALDIREMNAADVARAMKWAAEEGWNPGLDDAAAFRVADPSGFFIGRLSDQPVGAVSVVKYGAAFAFLGLYIVLPQFRGQGYGKAIWDAGLATAGNRTVGLDGVVVQQDNYRKSGFALAHNNIRFGGMLPARTPAGAGLMPVDREVMREIVTHDRGMFLHDRSDFLGAWLLGSESRLGLALVEDGAVRGYGAIRICGQGHKIGPLFADNSGIAERLLFGLSAAANADEIFIDVPEPNGEMLAMARALGLAPVFETARMYRGRPPDLPLGRIFGITTLELG